MFNLAGLSTNQRVGERLTVVHGHRCIADQHENRCHYAVLNARYDEVVVVYTQMAGRLSSFDLAVPAAEAREAQC